MKQTLVRRRVVNYFCFSLFILCNKRGKREREGNAVQAQKRTSARGERENPEKANENKILQPQIVIREL